MKIELTKKEFDVLIRYVASLYEHQYMCFRTDTALKLPTGQTKRNCIDILKRLNLHKLNHGDIEFLNRYTILCSPGTNLYIHYINTVHRKLSKIK